MTMRSTARIAVLNWEELQMAMGMVGQATQKFGIQVCRIQAGRVYGFGHKFLISNLCKCNHLGFATGGTHSRDGTSY